MKYIKLFENFFEIDFGNKLWAEVTDWWKWDELVHTENPEELTLKEANQILVILESHLKFSKLIKEHKIVKRLHTDSVNSALNISTEEGGTIIIYKFRDDRWMIETFDIPYLEDFKFACDGRDGLLEWIEYWKKKLR